MKNSDPQQGKAYKWEDSFSAWPGATLQPPRAGRIIEAAHRKFKVPTPKLIFPVRDRKRGQKKLQPSQYSPDAHSILIRPRHMNAAILLHESAHSITDWILGYGLQPHGPEWLGVYMVLLEDYGIMPREALHASADAAGLKYRTRAHVDPKHIRKRNRRRAIKAAAARLI